MPVWKQLPAVVLSLVLLVIAGCSRGPTPVAVSGAVTLDGASLPEGQVRFEPLDQEHGQARDAKILNGQFALPSSQGLLPGMEFRVIIKAFKKTGRKYPNVNPEIAYDEVVQYLPERYNAASNLKATISPNEDENKLAYDLVSNVH